MKRENRESIAQYFKEGNSLIFTHHFYQQMEKRRFEICQVYELLRSEQMKLIQVHPPGTYQYGNHRYNKNFVYVLSCMSRNFKAHIVIAQKGSNFIGVSIYRPSKEIFSKDDTLKKKVNRVPHKEFHLKAPSISLPKAYF